SRLRYPSPTLSVLNSPRTSRPSARRISSTRSMRFVPFWKSRAPGPSDCSGVRASDEITPTPGTDTADQLDRLVAGVDRLGREQFRTTTLLEGCGASLDELGEALQQHIDQELHEHTESLRALGALEDQVRLRLVKDLLPVADALQASILAAREV